MKRMKKLVSVRSVTVLTLALLIVFVSALAASKREKVSGYNGEWDYITSEIWAGTVATLTIGDITYLNVPYSAYGLDLSENDEGVYKGTTVEQIFDLPTGYIRTLIDRVILEPTGTTGVYTLKVSSTSVTGIVNGRTVNGGNLRIEGIVVNFPPDGVTPPSAEFQVSGAISY